MQIEYARKFTKMHGKAPAKMQKAFDKRLELFLKDPYYPILNNHWLSGRYKGFKSINVAGDWRAIFQEEDEIITFLLFGTHSQLYK